MLSCAHAGFCQDLALKYTCADTAVQNHAASRSVLQAHEALCLQHMKLIYPEHCLRDFTGLENDVPGRALAFRRSR